MILRKPAATDRFSTLVAGATHCHKRYKCVWSDANDGCQLRVQKDADPN